MTRAVFFCCGNDDVVDIHEDKYTKEPNGVWGGGDVVLSSGV